MAEPSNRWHSGAEVGAFVIGELLGVGGMGEVYRARDSKLDRDVAIKMLPNSLAACPEREARFQREARLLASLNHPNIASIYGLDEVGSVRFIVMELVEGQTLEDRIRQGALPVKEALEINRQIAVALEAAHENGVIHRDLKPANVKITPGGTVKVLDFGLAKALSNEVPDPTSGVDPADSPTKIGMSPDSELATQGGVLLGTVPYMSPEQARAQPVDKRSDIWSFGCVLYECLSGNLLFGGQSMADTLGAILNQEPDWDALPPDTPPTVQYVLHRCLTKDRRGRLHDIADARIELELAASHDPASSQFSMIRSPIAEAPGQIARRRRLSAVLLICAVVLAAVATWLVTDRIRQPVVTGQPMRLMIPSRSNSYYGATGGVISPDGRLIAFAAYNSRGSVPRIWVRPLDSFDARPLEGTEHVEYIPEYGLQGVWSYDGHSILFHRAGKLWSTRVDSGVSKLVAAVPESLGITCNKDGVILLSRGEGGICRIPASGGEIEVITSLDAARNEIAHVYPHFLPDGRRFLFLGLDFDPSREIRSRRLYAGSLDSREVTFISELPSQAAYVEPGFLVYVDGGAIFARPFDANRLSFTGEPRLLAENISYFEPTGAADLSVSRSGSIVFKPPSSGESLVWFDETGKRLGTVGERHRFRSLRISPDGSRCLVSVENPRSGAADLWIYGLERETITRLTSDTRFESGGIWAPDEEAIFYSSDLHGWPDVFRMSPDGSGPGEEVYRAPGQWFPQDVSPGGEFLLLAGLPSGGSFDLAVLSLNEFGEPRQLRSSKYQEYGARFSPDGKWVAYVSEASGEAQVYVTPFPEADRQIRISTAGGSYPVWAPDGTKLYFQEGPECSASNCRTKKLMAVDLDETSFDDGPGAPQLMFETTEPFEFFDIAPDGERFLLRVLSEETDPLYVVLNWADRGRPPQSSD